MLKKATFVNSKQFLYPNVDITFNFCMISQYFADCNEVCATMDEFDVAASNDDLGQDEDSAEELIKKHKASILDVLIF